VRPLASGCGLPTPGSNLANVPEPDKIRVDLTGPPETMLATLYAKALDANLPRPILGDRFAADVVSRIDYDWRRTTITAANSPGVTVRTAHFDTWVRQFLAVHDRAVVLHLGAGLDSRVFRLDPGPGVQWYDIDYPDVIALRERLYPRREHYRLVAGSVTDPTWLAGINTDHADLPALLVAEGLTMYLTRDEGLALLRRVVQRFSSGELQFDVFNRLGIRAQVINAVVRRSGSRLHWAVDGPDDIVGAVPGVRLLATVSEFDATDFNRVPPFYRLLGRVMSWVPALRGMAQFQRYAWG
jgi:methyltransferase (TIGR00027 family)